MVKSGVSLETMYKSCFIEKLIEFTDSNKVRNILYLPDHLSGSAEPEHPPFTLPFTQGCKRLVFRFLV